MSSIFKFNFSEHDTNAASSTCEAALEEAPDDDDIGCSLLPPDPATIRFCARCISLRQGDNNKRFDDSCRQAGVYEGGFERWECGGDLLRFVERKADLDSGGRIIELGCGQAEPTTFLLEQRLKRESECEEVHFQDYNRSVVDEFRTNFNRQLEKCTCQKRFPDPEKLLIDRPNPIRFIAGSWRALPKLLEEHGLLQRFQLVLSAETCYDSRTIPDLHDAIVACLSSSGRAYLAGKGDYPGDGCGGGTTAFEMYAKKRERLSVVDREEIFNPADSACVRREILTLRKID